MTSTTSLAPNLLSSIATTLKPLSVTSSTPAPQVTSTTSGLSSAGTATTAGQVFSTTSIYPLKEANWTVATIDPLSISTSSEMTSTIAVKSTTAFWDRNTPVSATSTVPPIGNWTSLPPNSSAVDSHSLSPSHLDQDTHYLTHSLLLQTGLVVLLLAALVGLLYIARKKHLDKLRHQLMPVYNFDPSDDGEDWETELLDDQFVHTAPTDPIQQAIQAPNSQSSAGLLKLDTGLTRGLKIQNNNSSAGQSLKPTSSSFSPTAMSGLLSSSRDMGANPRRMYTRDRDPVV